MDQQEQAFLSAALGVGDERLERRLLVGFHLVRDCCRLADDPTWVPRTRVTRAAIETAVADGAFAPGDLELEALTGLLETLETKAHERDAVYSALIAYAHALYREVSFPAMKIVLDVLDDLWTVQCHARDRLNVIFHRGLLMMRDGQLRGAGAVPIVLALNARAEREGEFIALAGALHHMRTLLLGNLPRVLTEGEKRLRQIHRHHPSLRAEGLVIHHMCVAHGRAGRHADALRIAGGLLRGGYLSITQLSALSVIGAAFTELGEFEAARAAFEIMLLAPTSHIRQLGANGLMDIHARRMEQAEFERIYDYLVHLPMAEEPRIEFWLVAGRMWRKLGDLSRARGCFDAAHALARASGLGYQIIESEELIETLPDPAEVARATALAPDLATEVTALRDAHADEIAACFT